MMTYLSVLDCPVVYSGESSTSTRSSIEMCPVEGMTQDLIRRHIRIKNSRMIVVCTWADEAACRAFFNPEWQKQAEDLWGDDYQLRLEAIEQSADA